ncbi:hypothetical protein ACFL9T_22300 [Thermodesulfobacteriota bacterium]
MDSQAQNHFPALIEIRDRVLLLVVGNAYLCEDPFLKKFGDSIDLMADKLKEDIETLKKSFPGKFVSEVDTNEILKGIQKTAQRLKEPDEKLNQECTVGALGRELETQLKSLNQAVEDIKKQVEGLSRPYRKTDAFIRVFSGLKDVLRPITNAGPLLLKIFLGLLVVVALTFGYLFFTMEKEGSLSQEIAQSEGYINSRQDELSRLQREANELKSTIDAMRDKQLTRQQKVELMELGSKLSMINNERQQIEDAVRTHEAKIADTRKKIEEIRMKSFIKRVFRQ